MAKILIITSKADKHTDYIVNRFAERKISFVRFDTELFPCSLKITYDNRSGKSLFKTNDLDSNLFFHSDEITSIWYRKPILSINQSIAEHSYQMFTKRETETFLNNMYVCMADRKWINYPYNNRIADNKLLQLQIAKEIGFNVPDTIVTNDYSKVAQFVKKHESKKIVYKTISHPFISETKESFRSVFTSVIDISPKLSNSIALAPCLFQEYIDKAYEIRITVIQNQVFAARIFSQDHLSTKIDWRRDQPKIQLKHEIEKIDTILEQSCIKLVKKLNLIFGTIDMIVTPTGQYVFLEINPNGQWLWIELMLGVKISDALIDALVG